MAERELTRGRRLRNTRLFAATVSALFLLASVAAFSAIAERDQAIANALQAQKKKKEAEDNGAVAERNRKLADENQ